MTGKVLLVSSRTRGRAAWPDALRAAAPGLAVDATPWAADALRRLEGGGYDAAVACVESSDELALVVRLKRCAPDLPVVVLSRAADPAFRALARSLGAESVVPRARRVRATAGALAEAVETARLARVRRGLSVRSKELADELRRLASEHLALVSSAMGLRASDRGSFTVLLVEDEPAQSRLFLRLLLRARLAVAVRTVQSVDEAVDYLRGPARRPLPALIVSDLQMPGGSGLDLLRWVRANPETRSTGFVMLTSSDVEENIAAAFEGGADLYLIKSARLEDAVEAVRRTHDRYRAERARPGTP